MNTNLFRLSRFYFLHDANSDGGQGAGTGENNNNQNQGDPENQNVTFNTFGDWYESLSEDQRKIVDPGKAHFDRVYSTLTTVRNERDDIDKKLKDAIKQMKDGPDKERFQELSNENDELKKKTEFLEDAPTHKCLNPKAAYAIVKAQNLYDKKNEIDWDALIKEAPELFGEVRVKLPRKRTSGANNQTAGDNVSMNNWIRLQAGKGVITQDQ